MKEDRTAACKAEVLRWFADFFETFSKSDKKTYKENLAPYFATEEECRQYVHTPYTA